MALEQDVVSPSSRLLGERVVKTNVDVCRVSFGVANDGGQRVGAVEQLVDPVFVLAVRDGKLAHENIYWDQASVLKQIGLLSGDGLPVHGAETARKVLDLQA